MVLHICDPVTSRALVVYSKMNGHLSQLDFTNVCPDESLEVDLLIGLGFYWEFVTGETIRGKGGHMAINTTLGWVLSGPAGVIEQGESVVSLVNAHTL